MRRTSFNKTIHPKKYNIEITPDYWLGECYQNDGWKRLTLFHKRTNYSGGSGSLNTPIAEIDIVKHPSLDGCNKHCEIKINVRNDLKRQGGEIVVDENAKDLRRVQDIVNNELLNKAVDKIKENDLVSLPFSVYVCVRHVDSFETAGDFWSED